MKKEKPQLKFNARNPYNDLEIQEVHSTHTKFKYAASTAMNLRKKGFRAWALDLVSGGAAVVLYKDKKNESIS